MHDDVTIIRRTENELWKDAAGNRLVKVYLAGKNSYLSWRATVIKKSKSRPPNLNFV